MPGTRPGMTRLGADAQPEFCRRPSSAGVGEYVYDTISAIGQQLGESGLDNFTIMNFFSSGPGQPTDYSNSLDLLQAQHPECQTVSLVVAWFFDSENAANCNV